MIFLTDKQVESFVNGSKNYDIRVSQNARWIDQKCTPDVLSIVADCIVVYVESTTNSNINFTSSDIWHSKYAEEFVFEIFRKPNVNLESTLPEYNKFFMQPMELLAYSGVLNRTKQGKQNIYSINNLDVLYYIASNPRNAYKFLIYYITKVLTDSGLIDDFNDFFDNQDSDHFDELKEKYLDFIIKNTKINGKTEASRIFSKVINPLAYNRNAKGTNKGRISKIQIGYEDLMYNRLNFRDIYQNKSKDMSRHDHVAKFGLRTPDLEACRRYVSNKAKREVQKYNKEHNNSKTEVEKYSSGELGTCTHHIFPVSQCPKICTYHENLICLDPSQHNNHAHPKYKTHLIDKTYQLDCLLAKVDTIEKDFKNGTNFYSFDMFITVLCEGFGDNSFLKVEKNNFNKIREMLLAKYVSL